MPLPAPSRADIAARVGDPRVPLDPERARTLLTKLTRREMQRAEPDIDYAGIMTDPKARVSRVVFDRCIGSLGVLGYSRAWLADALGVDVRHLEPGSTAGRVDPRLMSRALTAAIRIGSRWATPESTGQTPEQIEAAREQAIEHGYRPPVAYSNQYRPESGATSARRSSRSLGQPLADDTLTAKIEAMAHFCRYGGTDASIAERFNISDRTVGRTRRNELGLATVTSQGHTRVAPGQDDLVAAILSAADALAIFEDVQEAWKQLRAFAAARRERLTAERAAERARQHPTDREDTAA